MIMLSIWFNSAVAYVFGGLFPEQISLPVFGIGMFAVTGSLRSFLSKRERSGHDCDYAPTDEGETEGD